jgi:cytochrome c biogenesis protein ResB
MSNRDVNAPRGRTFSLGRVLRSRRLALWLILVLIAYAILGTLVPQASVGGGASVAAWQAAHPVLALLTRLLGLHQAYSSPLFLGIIVVLACSTAACALERTAVSWRAMRRAGTISEGMLRRLRERPKLAFPVSGDSADVLADVEGGLRRLHLRSRRGPKLLEASGGRFGLLGSPVFHVMLALLFVVIALGRLTRAEGFIGVPLDSSMRDTKASYGRLTEGPLYLGHTGYRIAASDLIFDYKEALAGHILPAWIQYGSSRLGHADASSRPCSSFRQS